MYSGQGNCFLGNEKNGERREYVRFDIARDQS